MLKINLILYIMLSNRILYQIIQETIDNIDCLLGFFFKSRFLGALFKCQSSALAYT